MNTYEIHKSNPALFPQLSLKEQLFLYYKCPQRERILQLYSAYNQLSFTISGKRIIHHGDQTWVTNKNRGLLLKRCAFIQELPVDNPDWEVLVLYLRDDYLKNVLEEFRPFLRLDGLPMIDDNMIQEFVINHQIRNCYESMIPYFERPHLLPDSIFEGKFKELLFNILADPDNKQILAYVNQIRDGYIVPIWEVMESNYMYDLNISDFAKIANRSTSTFKREFEEHYHTTPGKWLTAKRLNRAKTLLESSQKTISEITYDCGFNNVSHFSRIFKEKYKTSPSQYRRLNK